MAVTIQEDLVKGAEGRVTQTGKERDRIFYLEGLTPGSGIWAQSELELFSQKGVAYGSAHPEALDSDLVVIGMRGLPFAGSKTQTKYVATYGRPSNSGFAITPRISFSATARQTVTSFNADGTKITVQYSTATTDQQQIGRVTAFKPFGILIIERIEQEMPSVALQMISTTNADTFQGQPPDTWMMRNIDFTEAGFTTGYRVRYAIEYSAEKDFTPVAAFRNIFGDVPEDIDDIDDAALGNGWTRARPSASSDFGALNLPVVFI